MSSPDFDAPRPAARLNENYHGGRFPDLNAVVDHYNACMNLGLNASQKSDLIQYLISLKF